MKKTVVTLAMLLFAVVGFAQSKNETPAATEKPPVLSVQDQLEFATMQIQFDRAKDEAEAAQVKIQALRTQYVDKQKQKCGAKYIVQSVSDKWICVAAPAAVAPPAPPAAKVPEKK
jgi:hypothetical protein